MKPEARIKRALKDMLKSEFPQVWTYWPVSNGMGVHGIPDLIMCAGGKFIGVEVKAQGKKVTLLQAHQLQQIERAAGTSLVLSGDTAVDTLRAFLSCMHLPRAPDIQSHYPVQMVSLSQDEYDNLMTKSPDTIYHIVGKKP
jgi:hypothetical protein